MANKNLPEILPENTKMSTLKNLKVLKSSEKQF
jgi:hypothetical protein